MGELVEWRGDEDVDEDEAFLNYLGLGEERARLIASGTTGRFTLPLFAQQYRKQRHFLQSGVVS
jgi:hypothetical protein